ncbi:cytochrome c [Chitinophaga filiformis]|uniref:c-type cytochrome n=1 Tax=Chitinophaga filiformis TaxID=104663 RepID=UPI001F2036FD|nr:cytochrome c [Chitinophaga filiformis]MCF6407857.1 cytochrome c [Chitinophaga filiformis]
MKSRIIYIVLLLIVLACTPRRMPLTSTERTREEKVNNGHQKYMQYCQKCHPAGEAGLGPALSNNPAPGFIKRFQVRHGLGVMPAFKDDVISKEDVKDIMRYLRTVKHDPKLPG